jgi:hypothetical protein
LGERAEVHGIRYIDTYIHWPTRESATHGIAKYIEGWYNFRSAQGALGMRWPVGS